MWRKTLTTFGYLLAVAVVNGCGSMSPPPPPPPLPARPPITATATTTVPASVASTQSFHRGVNFDHLGGFGRRLSARQAAASLTHLRQLGVTHVAITPSFFQQTIDDTDFFWKRDRTDVDADARAAIRLAHENGLSVLLKPHLWLEDKSNGLWRGRIDPTGAAWDEWSANYHRTLLDYGRLAEEEKVAAMSIGSELTDVAVARPVFWRQLASDLRDVYTGQLTYASNWDSEFDVIEWWDAVDLLGVDAFWPLVDSFDAELDRAECVQRLSAIRDKMRSVARREQKPVLLTEIGYKSAVGAAFEPWQWHDAAELEVDLELQETIYQAIGEVFGGAAREEPPWIAGVYFWLWYADLTWGGRRNTDFTPRGKPAEQALAEWYGSIDLGDREIVRETREPAR